MKTQYVSDDGKVFDDQDECRSHERRVGLIPTAYAKSIKKHSVKHLVDAARDYAKWLRAKQSYPATDSGEHKCCDLMEEMALRLT